MKVISILLLLVCWQFFGCKPAVSGAERVIRVCNTLPDWSDKHCEVVEVAKIVCPPDDWGLFYADLSRFSQLQEIRFLRIKKPELSRKILDLKNLKKVSWIACESVGNLGAWKGLANVQQIDLIGKVKGLDELLEKARFSLRLKHLALHNMSLSGLPKSIFQLDQLKTLDLTGNQLATLSDAFGKFKNLERLILVDNNFSTIPEVLKRLPKLKWVDFYGNPIQFSDEDRHWLKGLEK